MSRSIELLVGDTFTLHRIIPMPPDGSCLFHSIAYYLFDYSNIQQTNRLRETIVDYVCRNWENLSVYTSAQNGDPYRSVEEYRASMLSSTTYGATSELKAAVDLYNIKMEVYHQDGVLLGLFGEERYPTKHLLFTGNLSSGHYDVCIPVEHDINDASISPDTLQENESLKQNKISCQRGRPLKRKRGRPKTSEKSREEQRRDANLRYKQAHPEVVQNAQKRYAAKHPEVNLAAVKRYTDKHPEVHQAAVKRYTEKNPVIDQISSKLYYTKKQLSYTNENDIINKLIDKIGKQKRLEAERIVKWVLERRKHILNNYCKVFDRVNSKITMSMEKMKSISSDKDMLEKCIILAGESKHVSSQEPYCYESSYKMFCSDETVPINDEGQAEVFNLQNENNNVSWSCNPKQ